VIIVDIQNVDKNIFKIMKKENKYYTPEIEEFYPGFEFEFHQELFNRNLTKPILYDSDWVIRKFSISNYHSIINELLDINLMKELLRVKYLDKKDIESLGWNNINDQSFLYQQEQSFELNIRTNGFSKKLGIQIYIMNLSDDYNIRNPYLFDGYIKNKSELKKLMKQLNLW